MLDIKHRKINKGIYSNIISTFLSILSITFVISLLVLEVLWRKNIEIVHMMLELLSIFIGVATFLIIWSKEEDDNSINTVLGFGFLIVALLDIMHTYYYKYLLLNDIVRGDSSIKYGLAAKLIQVITLCIFAYAPYVRNSNKYINMIKTIIIAGCLFYVFEAHLGWIPSFYDENGITQIKVVLEYLVIIIAVLALYKLKNNLQSEPLIRFEYLYICILLIIPSEICFTLFKNSDSLWVAWGHVLKVFSYVYLYKAVFQSLIHYPYDKLRDSNQRLSEILNAIPISIHTYNKDNRIEFVNDKFEEVFKYPKEKVVGLNTIELSMMLNKSGNKKTGPSLDSLNINEDDTKNIIRTYLDADNKEIKVLIKPHKIKDGVIVLANDVKQEQEIKNLNLQAQVILNAIAVPTIIIDYIGNIAACNDAFADLVEVAYKDIISMNIYELGNIINFSDKELIDAFDIKQFQDDSINCNVETTKGNKKQIKLTTSLITNSYNEKIGGVIVATDISKMREAQSRLINQEKLALVGQMGATIIHETRNFLATIKGNCQLLELYIDDGKIRQYTRKIDAATNEINDIISVFLNLSKPREAQLEEVAFNDLVASMQSTIETSSLMNKVQVLLKLDYHERYILCDETQIRQVILNMCKNAVDAMAEVPEPILHISTGLDDHLDEVFIKISDNGVGIDNKILEKIGTPFFTTKKTGTGLGLNVCYQIIKEHKGRIEVESELGQGTTFTIIIPCIDEALEDII
ncbi:MASE3 domain-containing protein [Cellulosilyticum sp. I15G10I2]|uniref:MASE3 domain-containing protein n=1 Tax=Cellulosilyticum sp. I15G10I2 TaxID=1892843 RepID=UPI00085BC411|nr:MASE3 domain-containing protein [Cellulosilyticum sp. I15G10I2]